MNLKLLPNRILVEPVESDAAIEVVTAQKGLDGRGRVVKVATTFFDSHGKTITADFKEGDVVHFSKGMGEELTLAGKPYRVLFATSGLDSEVLAVEQ